jgi:DNA helicase HerA-like ATPase
MMPAKSSRATALRLEETRGSKDRAGGIDAWILSADALDDRIAIVGTAGSGKTYAAKGFVERLLGAGARVAVVDPLGVWWDLRASATGGAAGYPVVVFGGKHADIPITPAWAPHSVS